MRQEVYLHNDDVQYHQNKNVHYSERTDPRSPLHSSVAEDMWRPASQKFPESGCPTTGILLKEHLTNHATRLRPLRI